MRRVRAYLTHWQRGPAHTEPYIPDDDPLTRLAVVGDVGQRRRGVDAIAAAIARLGAGRPYDALLLLGDNVYPSGNPARLPDTVFGPFAPVLAQGAELLAVLGNHDIRAGHGDAQLAALGIGTRWWTRRYPGVVVIGIDSNAPDDAEQRAFLADALTRAGSAWRVVALHHPPYSAGWYGSDRRVRHALESVFAETGHRADVVLSGHEHDYQRSVQIAGVTYVVSGATSKRRRTRRKEFTARALGWRHFVDVSVFADRLRIRAVGPGGRVGDDAVLTRAEA
jgi:3',5'-cyclic AMP phosphodiesterase CpdA